MAEKEQSEFRVVDKRRFSESGDVREGVIDERRDEKKQVADSGKAQHSATTAACDAASEAANLRAESRRPTERSEVRGEMPAVDFSSFVVSLATQAMVMLGELPNPETRVKSFNPEVARHTIDIISMLAEKTKNNLTVEEEKMVGEILASLRIAYVDRVRATNNDAKVG